MTSNKAQKTAIRQRMAATGEPYSVARKAIGAEDPDIGESPEDETPEEQYLREAEEAGVPAEELKALRAAWQARGRLGKLQLAADQARDQADKAEEAAAEAEERAVEAEDLAAEAQDWDDEAEEWDVEAGEWAVAAEEWDEMPPWDGDEVGGPRHYSRPAGSRLPRPPRPPRLPRPPRMPRMPRLPRMPRFP